MQYKKIKNKIKYFFNTFPLFSKLWNEYHNPIYYWWKARKYFKFPEIGFYYGKLIWRFGLPISKTYYNKFISIKFQSLGWKDKFDSPRFEWHPYITIVFFRKWQLMWTFYYIPEHTWEAILDILYYNKSINQAIKDNTWKTLEGNKITIIHYVKDRYKKEYK